MGRCRRSMPLGLAATLALATCVSPGAGDRLRVPQAGAVEVARPSASTETLEREAHELVNRHRTARGLSTLPIDARISRQARLHSVAMATGATPFGHNGFEHRVHVLAEALSCQQSAENVGLKAGYDDPAAVVVRDWLGSSGHRENIEGPYELTGVGAARSAAGAVYFTQMFGGRCAARERNRGGGGHRRTGRSARTFLARSLARWCLSPPAPSSESRHPRRRLRLRVKKESLRGTAARSTDVARRVANDSTRTLSPLRTDRFRSGRACA